MSGDLKMNLKIDTGSAVVDIGKAAKAAQGLGDDLEDTRSAGQKVADQITSATGIIVAQLKEDQAAADALAKAIGPELLSTAQGGIDGLVAQLKGLGLTSTDIKGDADALAAAFKNSSDAVSELQRVDTELADIEGSAKEAKTAVAGIGDADVSGATDGMHGLGDAVHDVDDKTGKAKDATRSFAGAAVGDSLAAATGMGALGESVSQVTEGLLEGEVGMAGLLTAGLGLAAVGIIMKGIESTGNGIAAAHAWDNKEIDAYVESLKEADGAESALRKRIEDTGKAVFLVGQSLDAWGETMRTDQDLTDVFARNGVTLDTFSAAVEDGRAGVDRFEAALRSAGVSGDDLTKIVTAARTEAENYTAANDKQAKINGFLNGTTVDLTTTTQQYANAAIHADDVTADLAISTADQQHATEAAKSASDSYTTAMEAQRTAAQNLIDDELSAIDAKYAARKATNDATEATAAYQTVLADSESTLKDVTTATDRAFDATIGKSEADVKASGAAANSKAGIDGQIASLQAQADALAPGAPLRVRIEEYIRDLNNIPTTITTNLGINNSGGASYVPSQAGKRAEGGPVSAGGRYLVGERGPEEVTFGADGYVTPNNRLGGTTNNNYYLRLPNGYSDPSSFIKTRTQAFKRGDRG